MALILAGRRSYLNYFRCAVLGVRATVVYPEKGKEPPCRRRPAAQCRLSKPYPKYGYLPKAVCDAVASAQAAWKLMNYASECSAEDKIFLRLRVARNPLISYCRPGTRLSNQWMHFLHFHPHFRSRRLQGGETRRKAIFSHVSVLSVHVWKVQSRIRYPSKPAQQAM